LHFICTELENTVFPFVPERQRRELMERVVRDYVFTHDKMIQTFPALKVPRQSPLVLLEKKEAK
jgi:hypothetical protein